MSDRRAVICCKKFVKLEKKTQPVEKTSCVFYLYFPLFANKNCNERFELWTITDK